MVACTPCAEAGAVCYYDREQSISCARCIEKRGTGVRCDGTFSLGEFRKIGEQKKLIKRQRQEKERQIAKLRAELASLESESVDLGDTLLHLKEVSDNMIRREMQALGVLDNTPQESVAFDVNDITVDAPVLESIDWDNVFHMPNPS